MQTYSVASGGANLPPAVNHSANVENITLALAILLGFGFVIAKTGQFLKIPSVTGYICAGIILGPSGLNVFSADAIGHQLGHFTQIALMLIAFGIGEHLEISRLRASARSLSIIGVSEIVCVSALVSSGSFYVATATGMGSADWGTMQYIVFAVLLGAVSVATAPAATMHVVRELRAAGPLTTSLMAVVAIDNGLAIMLFGIAMAFARHMVNAGAGSLLPTLSMGLLEIVGSLVIGVVTGLMIDMIISRLKEEREMLTAGLALLLLCGEGARLLNLSPLLAGMAVGFTIVNRVHRDIRLFRALNAFETPIYVLFFTLAGVHFDFSALRIAGWLGVSYFFLRTFGKAIGAAIGGRLSNAPKTVQHYLGLSLTPQAGVAIGLLFLIGDDPAVRGFSEFITPVVLTGVVLSELVGPVLTKFAITRAGEANIDQAPSESEELLEKLGRSEIDQEPSGVPMVPWTWKKLEAPLRSEGVVVFGASHLASAAALARLSTIIAHYYAGFPLAARIIPASKVYSQEQKESDTILMAAARTEVITMGSELYSTWRQSDEIAEGLLAVVKQSQTLAIVLGLTLRINPMDFQKILGKVIEQASCPTVVVKFGGIFHSERILIPVINMRELFVIRDIVKALTALGHQRCTFVRLLPSYERGEVIAKAEKRLARWLKMEGLDSISTCKAVTAEARQETILQESLAQDVIVMAGAVAHGLHHILFGSLANRVAQKSTKTLIIVYSPAL